MLLGEVWQNENMKCLFADGAVEIAEGEPNDDMWEKIYREMKQYFPGREVIGWAKKMEEPEEEPDEKLFDLHREQCQRFLDGEHRDPKAERLLHLLRKKRADAELYGKRK